MLQFVFPSIDIICLLCTPKTVAFLGIAGPYIKPIGKSYKKNGSFDSSLTNKKVPHHVVWIVDIPRILGFPPFYLEYVYTYLRLDMHDIGPLENRNMEYFKNVNLIKINYFKL